MNVTAQNRRESWREGYRNAVEGKGPHLSLAGEHIPDDGKDHDAFHGGGHALEHPGGEQRADVFSGAAKKTGEGETRQAPEQHGLPAEPVRQGAVNQGGKAVGRHIQANGQLDPFRVGVQQLRQVGQAGRVQVR